MTLNTNDVKQLQDAQERLHGLLFRGDLDAEVRGELQLAFDQIGFVIGNLATKKPKG